MGECFPGVGYGRSVTGNANGPMGVTSPHHGLMAHDGKRALRIQGHQGRALGKEGTVDVTRHHSR